MNILHRFTNLAPSILVLGLAGLATFSAVGAQKSGPTSANVAGLVPPIPSAEIPQSVFIIPSTPKEGRNPFFPQSTLGVPVPKPSPNVTPTDPAIGLVLNGITSPPRRTAMINGSTFEPGEEHEIKLTDGTRRLIKCEEIKNDSAIINVNGVRRELKLRSGL
jgi:hypothetical protein